MFLKVKLVFWMICLPAIVLAEGANIPENNLLLPRFQFQHQTINLGAAHTGSATAGRGQRQLFDRNNALSGQVTQYDATISYPFSRDGAVDFDLGINIRLINANFKTQSIDQQTRYVNATLPMFYASALFNLPYDGLSASLGGSHFEYDRYRAYDYKAKLSYTWQSGFGLEGGWQHQQLNIDGSDFQTRFEIKGPFLDLKYRF